MEHKRRVTEMEIKDNEEKQEKLDQEIQKTSATVE